jgi:Fe-S cluster assembly protein SufD
MTLENNYKIHSKEYIFSNNATLNSKRENIYSKLINKNFNKKNNESLKNISFSDLSFFDYYYKPSNEKPSVIVDEEIYKIKIVNGICKNYKDDKIELRNLSHLDSNKFVNQYEDNHDDLVVDFNKIFLNSGIFIEIKTNAKINLKFFHKTDKNYTIFQNNFLNFKKNCKVNIEDQFNFSINTINNINYNIHVDEQANIQHNIFQNFSNSNKLYLTTNTVCEKKSSYNQNTYNFAAGFVRNFHFAKLNGYASKAFLRGCFFLKDKNSTTNKTHITHNAENCESSQIYKGILNNFAKANYYSNTIVSKNAQKTEGYQLSKGILLTDNCYFLSKPELRIFADDVKCSHGSTIGPVDESALYYLRSRGISKNQAMKMIIASFIEEDLQNLDSNIIDRINHDLVVYLESLN